ncbi:peptide transporter family 1-like [Battus philenor]|uniref:peptide transporter family 1-like n=1 Tax=Battus philenor TaxID=42288 RepID=UPI0035D06242
MARTIEERALFEGLRQIGCPRNIFSIIENYVQDREVVLDYAEEGVTKTLTKGFVQGSAGGPIIWNTILNNLLEMDLVDGCLLQEFADDVLLITYHARADGHQDLTNSALGKILEWGESVKLTFGSEKTKVMAFTLTTKKCSVRMGLSILLSPGKRFPRIVLFILVAEFCERMSYSGMRVFLTLYLRNKLGYTDDEAREIYHIFNGLVYLCPVFGGILADNYLGKYRTILYMMFVYVLGNIFVALTAIPQLMLPGRLCTLLSLLMITLGTGGIKPCVTAFGGEQFVLPQQEKQLSLYFSILYFNLCIGSFIAKTLSPIFRADVHCFGDRDCYSLAFGAPVVVIIISIVVFVSGKRHYVIRKPNGNVVLVFSKCVYYGLKQKLTAGNSTVNSHWLDSARDKFDRKFIADVKRTLSVLQLFIVLPIFWSLLDQMGSSWVLQATRMDGRIGFYTIKPEQMVLISPITVLSFIALSQKYIYPFLSKWNLLTNPLSKIKLGGTMAGLAFVASGCVEMYLKTTYPEPLRPGFSQLRIFNGNTCEISIRNETKNIAYTIPSLGHVSDTGIPVTGSENVTFNLNGSCFISERKEFLLRENYANSFYLTNDKMYPFEDNTVKSKSGFPLVRFLITDSINKPVILFNTKLNNVELNITNGDINEQLEVYSSIYSLYVGEREIRTDLRLESGGIYTFIISQPSYTDYIANVITIAEPNSITMFLLVPQFVLVSIAEVLFAVTGNEFAFKEAPESMKAVITAIWLLTEAFGNALIIIFTHLWCNIHMEFQFFLYAAMMFVSMAIFHYQGRSYKFLEEIKEEEVTMIEH